MNERIRELAEQAIIVVDNHHLIEEEELKKMYIPDCFSETFAKYIIRECIETMYNTEQMNVAKFVALTLQEHFELEE